MARMGFDDHEPAPPLSLSERVLIGLVGAGTVFWLGASLLALAKWVLRAL